MKRAAVFCHLYYEELFGECIDYLTMASEQCDIFITTDTIKKCERLAELSETSIPKAKIELCDKRGREWAAYLFVFCEYYRDYEYVCYIHDKKSSQMFYPTVGESFFHNLWENSIRSSEYINGVMAQFDEKPWLGILAPPEVYHNTYFHTQADYWTICYEKAKKLLDEKKVEVPLKRDKAPIALGSVFWCRREAIDGLYKLDISECDLPNEPMSVDGTISHILERIVPCIAQSAGYFTGIIMNEDTAKRNIINYQTMLKGITGAIRKRGKSNMATYHLLMQGM